MVYMSICLQTGCWGGGVVLCNVSDVRKKNLKEIVMYVRQGKAIDISLFTFAPMSIITYTCCTQTSLRRF